MTIRDARRRSPVEVLVCTTCRTESAPDADGEREGARLHAALKEAPPEGVVVREVACLSNCSRSCSIVLRGPGRWTYVYGNLSADDAGTVAEGAALYAGTSDGLVPWRERPVHFRKNCIARIPPLEGNNG